MVEDAGSILQIGCLVTLFVAIIPSLFMSVAITQFWAFLNLLQLLMYIPLMNVIIPSNFEMFLTKYLSLSNFGIPTDLLPSWVPSPKKMLQQYVTNPFNDQFDLVGLNSLSFLYNFSEQFFLWILILISYFFICFLDCIRCKNSLLWVEKLKKEYVYNIPLRILFETYLHMAVCSFLTLTSMDFSDAINRTSFIGAMLALFLAVALIIISGFLLEGNMSSIRSDDFKQHYGTLIEGVNCKKTEFLCRQYNTFFVFRRLCYALLIISLLKYPNLQPIIVLFVTLIPQFIYLITVRPFNKTKENFLNIFNELIVIFIFYAIVDSIWILELFSVSRENNPFIALYISKTIFGIKKVHISPKDASTNAHNIHPIFIVI